MRSPIVIVPACVNQIGAHANHTAQFKYVAAVADGAGCTPLIMPALGAATDFEALLALADGVMLTGSPSNVHAGLYGQEVLEPSLPQDAARDATTLPFIRAALKRGIPLLAICRGFQELNVALGGTLHQRVHDVPGRMDHREDPDADTDSQYEQAHPIHVEGGSLLGKIAGEGAWWVNSLHHQGIDRLAPGLFADATAPDGQIEAVSMPQARGFVLGVQWHPEWRWAENPLSRAIFQGFGGVL